MPYQSSPAGIRDVIFGENVQVVEPCNFYECSIGDDCFVGPFVEIQKGVVIASAVKFNHTVLSVNW